MTTFQASLPPIPSTSPDPDATVTHAIHVREVMSELQRVIVGQERLLERVLVGLLAGGHLTKDVAPTIEWGRLDADVLQGLIAEDKGVLDNPDEMFEEAQRADTAETLAARVIVEEHKIYPIAARWLRAT